MVLALLVSALLLSVPCQSASLQHWFAPTSQKVYPDTTAPAEGYPPLIMAALGEYEALQLVLRSEEDVPDLQVLVRPPRQLAQGSASLPLANVELFEARYVPTPADKKHPLTPDPLVPVMARDGTAHLSLKGRQTTSLWVRVHVPEGAQPGAYVLRLILGQQGQVNLPHTETSAVLASLTPVDVRVLVLPFRLPRRTHVRTAFGISGSYVALQHGIKPEGEAYEELYRRYYDELLRHRVCAYHVPYGVTDWRALPYLRDERVNAFVVPYTADAATLARTWRYLVDRGVAYKAWVYPLDEPVRRQQYEELKKRAALVHRAAPGLKVCSPFYRGPDWDKKLTPFDELVGYLDIWCVNTLYYSRPQITRLIRERQEKGEEAWWYVCCGPGSPFCNFFVNMAALQHRLLPWQMYRYGITGLLYWSTTYWNPKYTKNPFEDMATVKDINRNIYGDGSLFYPGSKVGLDGPVTSVRLECLRDGLEDYEYLVLARRCLGEEAVEKLVEQITPELRRYETDAVKFEQARRELAERITEACRR
ncbi:MAG: DUF4091 domain-containing protein [Armatimonadetes bacterium]|nr:DUF4091 domain-containing protein [Armatimonadota bacterium]